jgi:hypothetical protein
MPENATSLWLTPRKALGATEGVDQSQGKQGGGRQERQQP